MPPGNIIRSVRQTVLRKTISHLLCNRFDTLHGQRIRPRHRQHNLLVGVDDAADRVGAGLMDDGVERQDFEWVGSAFHRNQRQRGTTASGGKADNRSDIDVGHVPEAHEVQPIGPCAACNKPVNDSDHGR